MGLGEKVAQRRFCHIGARGDVDEIRRGRPHDRPLRLVLGQDMASCARFERDLAALDDELRLLSDRGRRARKRERESERDNGSGHDFLRGRGDGPNPFSYTLELGSGSAFRRKRDRSRARHLDRGETQKYWVLVRVF